MKRIDLKLTFLLWATAFILTPLADASAVDRVDIDVNRDSRFLPYTVEVLDQNERQSESRWVVHPRRVYKAAKTAGDSAIVLAADNMSASSDSRAMVQLMQFPGGAPVKELPNWLTISDIGTFHRTDDSELSFWFAGFLRDSAWILSYWPVKDRLDSMFVATGIDRTGNGHWECQLFEVAAFDYDHDGLEEQFFYLNAALDLSPRLLVCARLETRQILWTVPVASTIPAGCVVSCGDSTDTGVLLCTYAPGQGSSDPIFNDSCGYLVRINQQGRVVSNKLIARYSEGTALLQLPDGSGYYLLHSLPFLDGYPQDGEIGSPSIVSRLDRFGKVAQSTVMPERIASIWLADYDGDTKPDLYTLSFNGVVRIISTEMMLLAESGPTNLWYTGQMRDWIGRGPVLFFNEGEKSGVYTPRFEKLAVAPKHEYRDIFSTDGSGSVTAFLGADANGYFVGRIRTISLLDMATVFYVDNQKWVLAALTSLLVGLFLVNFYRRRITRQNRELAETHEALKQAQQTIIAQEKYRQAKDIAGGFAHEIRNALFPADSSLTKLRTLGDLSQAQPEKITALHDTIRGAVLKAVDITKQISQYTKLESDYHPGPVNLRQVVETVLQANRLRIDDCNVEVRMEGDPAVSVSANTKQLYSVFNNLLLNSLDALTNRTNPAIMIAWSTAQGLASISFSDNGIGITEQDQKRVFDTFFSTKPNTGTGLGLAVAKRIVEMYGGSIVVSSTVGEGTRFEIRMKQA